MNGTKKRICLNILLLPFFIYIICIGVIMIYIGTKGSMLAEKERLIS